MGLMRDAGEMNMKYFSMVRVGVWLLLSFCLVGSQMKPEPEEILLNTIQEMGVEPELVVLHHGSRVEQMSSKQLDSFVIQLMNSLQLKNEKKETNRDGIKYIATGKIGRNINIDLNVINDEPTNTWIKPYISVQLKGRGKLDSEWAEARNLVVHALRSNEIIPKFHISFQGAMKNSSSGLEQPIVQALEKLHAREVESMRTSHTLSISAYSPRLPDRLKTGGGWMNVQVASRMSHDNQRLIFTIGTPIITIEY